MNSRLTRRQMLRRSAWAGITVCAAGTIRAHGQEQTPNDKLNVAGIGVGGRGAADVGGVAGENIVALCDVDERRAAGTFGRFPKARKFKEVSSEIHRLELVLSSHNYHELFKEKSKRDKTIEDLMGRERELEAGFSESESLIEGKNVELIEKERP